MALGTKQVALSTTAAKIADARVEACTVKVKNKDASIVIYVGAIGVTSATGYPLAAGAEVTLELSKNSADLYAVAASGTPSACVMRLTN
jgi:predicted N-acetyltransferase YhbS